MTYAVIADVQALNPKRTTYSGTTTPSTTQVGLYMDQIAAEIDAVLAAQAVQTPVTAPTSFVTFLKGLNSWGAAALAEMGAFPEAPGGAGDQANTPHGARLWAMYQAGLEALKDGSAIDPATAHSASGPMAETYLTAYPDNDPYDDGSTDGQQPAFSMGRNLRDF